MEKTQSSRSADKFYTNERHTQILIALMKFHNIKKVIVSPGATNVCFVGSIQNDPYFQVYSSVDERSAAYMACGLARESGEPVALSCTGATASRNYVPALTEAYYSNLPILAITSTQHPGRIGQLVPQVIDRSVCMKDVVKKSIQLRVTHTEEDQWVAEVAVNDALLELRRHGGGPVHINLETTYSPDFSVKTLTTVRGIRRYCLGDVFPDLKGTKIVVNVGAHDPWTEALTQVVDQFCEQYNAVVVCEQISNYCGKYGVYPTLFANQGNHSELMEPDIMIHLGTVSGFGAANSMKPKAVWRVHPDGEIRDTFKKLTAVFEMQELQFFNVYCQAQKETAIKIDYHQAFQAACRDLAAKVPALPFSNAWIAQNTVGLLPEKSELHLGILNSVRCWSLFEIDHAKQIEVYSNTGGFGIDGMVSTLLGSSLTNPEKLYIGIIGDLAFFYDMNAIGNRHVGKNIRIMLINNGRGTEFRNFNHLAERFGEDADAFMAAAGHFGNQSRQLVKHYAEDLGFEYLNADNKEDYLAQIHAFLDPASKDRPVIFEVFTDSKDESDALEILFNLDVSATTAAKNMAKKMLGEKGVRALKKMMKK